MNYYCCCGGEGRQRNFLWYGWTTEASLAVSCALIRVLVACLVVIVGRACNGGGSVNIKRDKKRPKAL